MSPSLQNEPAQTQATETESDPRAAFVAGLRDFADWLESHPDVPYPTYERLLLPLSTNEATEAFAAEHGLTVTYDDGNAEAPLQFGPITYLAYGYADFKAHVEKRDEANARAWADRKGMEILPKGGAR